jgi:hypothetical protein
LLIVHSQTELALNTNTIVSGMDRNVTKILDIVSNTSGTGAMVRDGISSEHLPVSIACILFITERALTLRRLEPGQRSRLPVNPAADICI